MKGLGFDALGTVLYSMPAGAIGFVAIIFSNTLTRYYPKVRFPLAMAYTLMVVFVLLFVGTSHVSNWAKYGVFVFWPLASVGNMLIWPLMSVNIAGRTKKSFFAGMSLLAYSAGNIVGSQIMRPSDAPKYLKGLTGCAICLILNVTNLAFWLWYYRRTNKRRDREFAETGMNAEVKEHEMRLAGKTDLTDIQNTHFRYSC
jgi:predicted MFS family arabinose efflux permease